MKHFLEASYALPSEEWFETLKYLIFLVAMYRKYGNFELLSLLQRF